MHRINPSQSSHVMWIPLERRARLQAITASTGRRSERGRVSPVRPLARREPECGSKRRPHCGYLDRLIQKRVADAEYRGLQRESLVAVAHRHPMGFVSRLADKHRDANRLAYLACDFVVLAYGGEEPACGGRPNIDHWFRGRNDQGRKAAFGAAVCG